jgi:hypothetical protein
LRGRLPSFVVPTHRIERAILLFRGHKVILDSSLAELYGVEVRELNQAVRRNLDRFPKDFMVRLRPEESRLLRSQFVILEKGRGRHPKYPPLAFTEQGVAMLSSVLHSPRAVRVNIEIMRAFVRMRRMLASNAALARRLQLLEQTYDSRFKVVFQAISQLMDEPHRKKKRAIGFRAR